MSDFTAFAFRVLAGALFAAAVGVLVDALFGINGWWVWGLSAGSLAGALLAYRRTLAVEAMREKAKPRRMQRKKA